MMLIVIGIVVLIYEFVRGHLEKKEEEEELVPQYYEYEPQPQATGGPSSYTSYQSRAAKNSILTQVLNSIDPVDMSFRFMEIENSACRKRTLCELSATPLIGRFFRYISPSISSLNEYQEAMSAGEAAIQDCALLFSECPENLHFIRK
ncbi:unnamed protein product [Meganyctiphanes norvegica]|uniref:Uncharacterized protein n=1 Tax=Meganyctiphanes norvegica TaxID=48144 RepID=A0AAV2Q088_MEGNR